MKRATKTTPAVLSVRRAAQLLGVTRCVIKAMIESGVLRAIRLGVPDGERKHLRVLAADVRAVLRGERK